MGCRLNGSTLKYLAGVADLARLDLEAAAITLVSQDGQMTACYAGMYARGLRRGEAGTPDFSISISAVQFKDLAAMFTDEESVAMIRNEAGLLMQSRHSHATLRQWGEESEFPTFDRSAVDFAARLPANVLISEIDAAQEFTAESMLRPALTGIRLVFGDVAMPKGKAERNKLHIEASDGFAVLFQADVDATVKGEGELVVPTSDFILGARLTADGDAILLKPRGEQAVVIYNATALFRSSLIAAPWPNIDRIVNVTHTSRLQVEAAQVRNLTAGVKTLGSGPEVSVTNKKGRVEFRTESEAGSYSTTVKGKVDVPMRYGAEYLSKLVKLGPVLDFNVPAVADDPTLVVSEHRRCWIMPRG